MGVSLVGEGLFLSVLLLPPPAGLSFPGWHVLGVSILMASLWMVEAIPFAVTALLPLVLFPVLGISDFAEAAAPFANPVIFLFLGGFFLAQAMERCQLHMRLALWIVRWAGTRESSLVAALLACSAFLSMWLNNTAVALLMLPIAVSTIRHFDVGQSASFSAALVLSVAYGSSIGGMATLVGTPSNAIFAGYLLDSHGISISFTQWMALAMPVCVILLFFAWIILTKFVFRLHGRVVRGEALSKGQTDALPPLSADGWRVLTVLLLAVALWVFRGLLASWLPWLTDAGIAMAAGISLFFVPSRTSRGGALLNTDTLGKIPFDVLLLIGGGLSLAAAMQSSGLAAWVGSLGAYAGDLPPSLVLLAVGFAAICLAELTSNTATTAAFLPIFGALATGLGHSPATIGGIVTLASSCGFMLPVSTPPNAIVYASGFLTLPQMLRAGLLLNLGALLLLTLWFGWVYTG
ncbi:MAG: DASS family sodium-coupled anion symporter [bacterium]